MFAKVGSLIDKVLSCPRIMFSKSQTLIFDVVETGVSLLVFAQQLRRKTAGVLDVYLALLDADGIPPTPVLYQNAIVKKMRKWVL